MATVPRLLTTSPRRRVSGYRTYAQQVRREFKHVPWPAYIAGRSKVLQAFIDAADGLYHHPHTRALFQHTAVANMTAEVAWLRDPTTVDPLVDDWSMPPK